MITLALIGYGKMGKEIESVLDSSEFTLTGKYDLNDDFTSLSPAPEVAIEFTTPNAVMKNIEQLASENINIVCGTTGWYDRSDEVRKIIEKYDVGFIYASNFSVGVNIFFNIVRDASKLINLHPQYEISVEETHHTQKLDKPSGTAIRAAENLLARVKRKHSITSDKEDPIENEINIVSKRTGNTVGNHKVIFDSKADTIILEHNAKSRRGFAEGALLAAKYIHGKKGFFKFEDIFNNLI